MILQVLDRRTTAGWGLDSVGQDGGSSYAANEGRQGSRFHTPVQNTRELHGSNLRRRGSGDPKDEPRARGPIASRPPALTPPTKLCKPLLPSWDPLSEGSPPLPHTFKCFLSQPSVILRLTQWNSGSSRVQKRILKLKNRRTHWRRVRRCVTTQLKKS